MNTNTKSIIAVILGLALVASIATNIYLDGQNGNLANQLSTVNSHNTILATEPVSSNSIARREPEHLEHEDIYPGQPNHRTAGW